MKPVSLYAGIFMARKTLGLAPTVLPTKSVNSDPEYPIKSRIHPLPRLRKYCLLRGIYAVPINSSHAPTQRTISGLASCLPDSDLASIIRIEEMYVREKATQ